jgi:hypothetical protein
MMITSNKSLIATISTLSLLKDSLKKQFLFYQNRFIPNFTFDIFFFFLLLFNLIQSRTYNKLYLFMLTLCAGMVSIEFQFYLLLLVPAALMQLYHFE